MSVQTEITRIQTDRNTLRTKGIALGIGVTSGSNLDDIATKYNAIAGPYAPQAEVREGETYSITPGYYTGGSITGIAGGGSYTLQAKTTTPTTAQQVIAPDNGYYGLSQVTVNAIPAAYQDVTSVTATAADVLATKIIVTSDGTVTTGTMTNNGSVSQTLNTSTTSYTVPAGYHSGSGTVSITTESKTATPNTTTQTISPSNGKVLSSVTVNPIPANYADATNLTATAANILSGATAISWSNGAPISLTGSMTNNGAVSGTITGLGSVAGDTTFTIPAGYTTGGTVSLTSDIETALAAI